MRILNDANKAFNTADHLAFVTYNLVKDQKLILSITENLSKSLILAMDSILTYDRLYKRISLYPDNFDVKFDIFKGVCARRYNFEREHMVIIEDLKKLVDARKQSMVEFVRKDKYVFGDKDYNTKTITLDKLKNYINECKPFMSRVNQVLKNAAIRF